MPMKQGKVITILVFCIILLSTLATSNGILSDSGSGPYEHQSIRGKQITIYRKGLYRHMSANVAIQGKAQDYVTLFIAIPLVLVSLIYARKGSIKGRLILAGCLNYFFLTYLFYLEMAMYNYMFLAYSALVGTSFFALALVLLSFEIEKLPSYFTKSGPLRFGGGFLIFNSIIIALLWLSVVVPPLLDGTIIPDEVEHYTTLTVQGLDLGLFLPISFVSGLLILRKNPFGFLMTPVTLVFLSLLMTALLAKLIAMALSGVNVIPAVFIIPAILITSITCSFLVIKNIMSAETK